MRRKPCRCMGPWSSGAGGARSNRYQHVRTEIRRGWPRSTVSSGSLVDQSWSRVVHATTYARSGRRPRAACAARAGGRRARAARCTPSRRRRRRGRPTPARSAGSRAACRRPAPTAPRPASGRAAIGVDGAGRPPGRTGCRRDRGSRRPRRRTRGSSPRHGHHEAGRIAVPEPAGRQRVPMTGLVRGHRRRRRRRGRRRSAWSGQARRPAPRAGCRRREFASRASAVPVVPTSSDAGDDQRDPGAPGRSPRFGGAVGRPDREDARSRGSAARRSIGSARAAVSRSAGSLTRSASMIGVSGPGCCGGSGGSVSTAVSDADRRLRANGARPSVAA